MSHLWVPSCIKLFCITELIEIHHWMACFTLIRALCLVKARLFDTGLHCQNCVQGLKSRWESELFTVLQCNSCKQFVMVVKFSNTNCAAKAATTQFRYVQIPSGKEIITILFAQNLSPTFLKLGKTSWKGVGVVLSFMPLTQSRPTYASTQTSNDGIPQFP